MGDPLTLCKLVSFNPDGTVYDEVDFLGKWTGCGANLAFAAPPSARRQQWGGGNVYKPGDHLRENTYENGAISITPTVDVSELPGDYSCREKLERLRMKLMGMFEDARLYEQHQQDSGKLVKLYDDHKGFDIESQIIDGWVEGLDDLDAYEIDQETAHFSVTMTRKPFRYAAWVNGWGEEGERLQNLVQEPSFLQDANGDGLSDNWYEVNAADATPTLITADYVTGLQCQRVQCVADGANDTGIRSTLNADGAGLLLTVTASTQYYLSWYLKHISGNRVTLKVYDDIGAAFIAGARIQWTTADVGWVEKDMMFTTPVGCTRIAIYIVVEAADGGAGNTDFYTDKGYVTDRRNLLNYLDHRVGWGSNHRLMPHWDENGNHGVGTDDQSHTNVLDVEDVYGDIPIKPRIWLYDTDGVAPLIANHTLGSRFTRPWELQHWAECGAGALAAASNADYSGNIAIASGAWTSINDRVWPIRDLGWYVPGEPNLGTYLVFAKMGCAAIPNTFYVRAKYGLYYLAAGGEGWASPVLYTDPIYVNQTFGAGMTNWPMLGSVRFPREDFDRSGLQPQYLRVDLEIYQSSGGPLNFQIDFMCIVPTEGGVSRSIEGSGAAIVDLIVLEPDDRVLRSDDIGGTFYVAEGGGKGTTPALNHKGPTRLFYQPYGHTNATTGGISARIPTKIDWRPTFL